MIKRKRLKKYLVTIAVHESNAEEINNWFLTLLLLTSTIPVTDVYKNQKNPVK